MDIILFSSSFNRCWIWFTVTLFAKSVKQSMKFLTINLRWSNSMMPVLTFPQGLKIQMPYRGRGVSSKTLTDSSVTLWKDVFLICLWGWGQLQRNQCGRREISVSKIQSNTNCHFIPPECSVRSSYKRLWVDTKIEWIIIPNSDLHSVALRLGL